METDRRAARDQTENLMKGQVSIDDFSLLKCLGRGGFGRVMLVEKKSSKLLYAMKIIKKQVVVEKKQIEHIQTEKHILQQVSLQNIPNFQIKHPFLAGIQFAFQIF